LGFDPFMQLVMSGELYRGAQARITDIEALQAEATYLIPFIRELKSAGVRLQELQSDAAHYANSGIGTISQRARLRTLTREAANETNEAARLVRQWDASDVSASRPERAGVWSYLLFGPGGVAGAWEAINEATAMPLRPNQEQQNGGEEPKGDAGAKAVAVAATIAGAGIGAVLLWRYLSS
jgi:hypothetical protein